MLNVSWLLILLGLVLCIASAITPRIPLWVSVLLLAIALLLSYGGAKP